MLSHAQIVFCSMKSFQVGSLYLAHSTLKRCSSTLKSGLTLFIVVSHTELYRPALCLPDDLLFAEYCTLLDISEGMLAGRQCPLEHKLGAEKDVFLGGQIFKLKVSSRNHACQHA